MSRPPLWTFRAFRTPAGNAVVQEWFNYLLSVDERDALRDRVNYLKDVERLLWKRPSFDALDEGICEIRKNSLRIYGYFPAQRHCFVFLHGTDKKVTNDKDGKAIARKRMGMLIRGEADTHEFDFEEKSHPETQKGQAEPRKPC